MNKIELNMTGTSLTLANNRGFVPPQTITLNSTSGSRAIELSSDSGVNYFVPELDSTSTDSIVLTILAPVTHIKFTGLSGDKITRIGV